MKAPVWIRFCNQAANAPAVDGSMTVRRRDGASWSYDGVAILLAPWRRDEHGQRPAGWALFVGVLRRRDGLGAARWIYRPKPRRRLRAQSWW